jgi:hypothetical protein
MGLAQILTVASSVLLCKLLHHKDIPQSITSLTSNGGCAIAQAVSRWLPTAVARVQVGFAVDKLVLGQVFSEYFGFPCQSSFHQILHHHNHPGQVQ